MNTEKRPAYFRFFLEACDMISLLDEEGAGRVIHAVSDYFSENIEPEKLSKNERIVFNRIRRDIDKSFSDYEAAVMYGKQGATKRHGDKGSKGGHRVPIGGLPNPEPKTQNPEPKTKNTEPINPQQPF